VFLQIAISSMEIVADSTIGVGDFAATTDRATWVSGPKDSERRQSGGVSS
jgi:hypothetical protein